MIRYTGRIIDTFPEGIKSTAATPAVVNNFQIIDKSEAKFLNEEQYVLFHHTVEQLIFKRTKEQRDI